MNSASTQNKKTNPLKAYFGRIRAFQPNARLYLIGVVLSGISYGTYRLLFNFYVLSLGYDESLLGQLITISSTASLIAALPMGYLSDMIGRKRSMVIGWVGSSISILLMLLFPTHLTFILANILFGAAQSLSQVSSGPFIIENSSEVERTYLFSFSMGFTMTANFVGNWLGGYLPKWMGLWQKVEATSSAAYGWALSLAFLSMALAIVPLFFLRRPQKAADEEKAVFAPFQFFKKQPTLLMKLIFPSFIISIGAGLIMPFINVYFRTVHHQTDAVIGTIFAWGSLAMAIGVLIAPSLADRFGKIKVVMVTQALSIPFLAIMGFVPIFEAVLVAYYFRIALMNMSNPVYQTFILEKVDPSARGMVASLNSMAFSFGWAFSPVVSGWIQVRYGFQPAFAGTILSYAMAVFSYWLFFMRKGAALRSLD